MVALHSKSAGSGTHVRHTHMAIETGGWFGNLHFKLHIFGVD